MDDLKGPLKGLAQASSLPAKVYCDADVARREREAVFRRHWQYLGHESQLPEVGTSLFVDVAGMPIVIVREREGLRAYEAVCRHRAGPLEACHSGGQHFLRCRYHGWAYGHDGALINATEMQGCEDFEPGEIRLPAVELAILQGLIFARLVPGPVGFEQRFPPLGSRLVRDVMLYITLAINVVSMFAMIAGILMHSGRGGGLLRGEGGGPGLQGVAARGERFEERGVGGIRERESAHRGEGGRQRGGPGLGPIIVVRDDGLPAVH